MIKRINKVINNMKIKTKLFSTCLFVTIITLLIIVVYLSPKMTSLIIENAIKETNEYNNTVKDRVKNILELAVNISDITYYEEKLHDIVTEEYGSNLEVFKAYSEYQMLDKYAVFSDEIKSIRLYVDNDTLLTNSNIVKVKDDTKSSIWYEKALNDKGLISWYYKKDEFTGEYNLSLVREIRSDIKGHIGVLVIAIEDKSFGNIIMNSYYKYSILLDGVVIESGDLEKGSKIEDLQVKNEATLYKELNYEYKEGNNYKSLDTFKINKSSNNTFQVLGEVSLALITKEPMDIIRTTIISTLLVITISLILAIYFFKNFYGRIDNLRKQMNNVVEGNFIIEDSIEGNDEISEIYDDLKIMMNSINQLIDDVYKKEIQEEQLIVKQKEIEFKMLSSQINPHFLYNTLETIRMRAFCNGDKELATIVKKLGKLMRRNLQVSHESVSLKSEIESIRDYLDIQGLRFDGKIEYEINSNIDIDKYAIMPLLLQPIVENSIIHGIEKIKGKGKLDINIYENSAFLVVDISDNGCGIKDYELENINNNLEKNITIKSGKNKNERKSIGISNINERIKMFYGQQYGVRIFSEENSGTKVLVVLPVIKEEE